MVIGYEIDFVGTLISWTHGRAVAALVVLGAGGRSWAAATKEAARRLDSVIVSREALR